MTYPAPPAHIEAYVRVLGTEDAVKFFMAFGGAELIYSQAPRTSRLAEVVGIEAARALAEVDRDRGLPRRVPMPKGWLARCLKQQGLSVAEIARRMHASDVAVRRWLKQDAAPGVSDPRQPTLF